jgi:dTDP-4-amino-4,6-dideoxygalactose transaminase
VRIRKTISPAAAPLTYRDLLSGIRGCVDKGIPERLEDEIRQYFHADHVFFLSSGKAAFFLILCALKELANRKKVIIPAYTCYSVPSAIRKAGLEIVPCDIRADTLDFDFEQLERLCDDKTLCVVPTHLFGIPSDVSRVREITGRRGIFIVEDAAQALGVSRGKEKLGTLGDVAFFSFGRGKNITCGSGGLIITSSGEIAEKIRSLHELLPPEPISESSRTFLEVCFMKIFLSPYLYWLPSGLPFLKLGETKYYTNFPVYRMSGFKAGLLRHWKKKLERENEVRTSMSTHYIKTLDLNVDIGIYSNAFPCLRFPVFFRDNPSKNAACDSNRHLGISPMYPRSVNGIREIQDTFVNASYPSSENIAKTLVTLPTHPFANGSHRDILCTRIKESPDLRYRGITGRGAH